MAMDWFRSYHGAPTDAKWLVVARRAKTLPGIVSAVWYALEDYASQQEDRGSVAGFDVETYAAFSGFEEDTVHAVVAALRDKGLINTSERLTAWDRRQPKREDETAAERKRRQREREREGGVTPPPNGNSHAPSRTVTPESHDVTPDKKREEKKREEENPPSAAASSPGPAHAGTTREEAQAAARPAADGGRLPDAPQSWGTAPRRAEPNRATPEERAAAMAEIQAAADEYAATIEGQAERRAFAALARQLANGDDATSWRHPAEGGQVPWSERPRLFRNALALLAAGERQDIRRATVLAVQRALDPLPVTTSEGLLSSRGQKSEIPPEERPAPDNPSPMQRIVRWEEEHPTEKSRLLTECWQQVGGGRAGTELYNQRVLEILDGKALPPETPEPTKPARRLAVVNGGAS